MIWNRVFAFCALALTIVACGSASVGDACNEEGKIQDQCEDGAICGKNENGALFCLQQCVDGAQCPSGYECGGISKTNVKGCRLKK